MSLDMSMVTGLIEALGDPADPEVIEQAVSDWLDDHPEAVAPIDDTAGEGDTGKLWSADKTAGEVDTLTEAIVPLTPAATSGDVGKFLKAKTVSGGKVTEYEFGEGGGGSVTVDDALSDSSTNPVQNKVITGAITQIQNSGIYKTAPILDGYNASNASVATLDSSPFMVAPVSDGSVKSIKIKINTTGNLSIGTIKASYATAGSTFDFTKVNIHEVLSFTETGEQTKNLMSEMPVASDEYIVLGVRDDTVKFYYGNYGTDKGFRWVNSSNKVANSTNSLGVTFIGMKTAMESVYAGKTLSIFGDSISTFTGYIPEGNATYYTGNNCGVSSVNDTWWKKTIDALGMSLLVNNSWSGRAVSSVRDNQTGHGTDAGYKEANVLQLASGSTNPDIIIVKLGINDFNDGCQLGTYDGSEALPNDPSKFTNAYAMMMDLIMTNFPLAKVYCCTLMQCEKTGTTGFPEINSQGDSLGEWNDAIRKIARAFGAEILDHSSCGITYYNLSTYMGDYNSGTGSALHPNAIGHSLIANKTIDQMDAFVRVRY